MKNKMQLGMCSALLIGSLVGGLGAGDLAAYASSNNVNNKVAQNVAVSQFKDVKKDHYAFEAIEWGKNKGLINGYTDVEGKPNGLFGASDNVTEAQFVKMVSVYLGLKDTAGNITKNNDNGAHWSDTHYDAMAKHGVPLNGYFDNVIRNNPMKRGSVAQALGYLLGDTSSLNDSINYLLSTGVTSGQNPQYEGKDLNKFFGSTNNLTRGQVITFLYRMDNKNLNNLSSIADVTSSDTNNLYAKAKEGYSYVDVALGGNKNTSNTDNTNTGKYADFFGPAGSGNNGSGSNTSVVKTEDEIIKEVNSVLGSKNVELLKKNNVPVYRAKVQNDGTLMVVYLKDVQNDFMKFTIYVKDGVIKDIGALPDKVSIELFSNVLGIPKSQLTGTLKDTKIVHSKYKIYYSSDGVYNLLSK